ncbi:unnamed protein product [Closterium sp. NIES-53]
MVDVVEPTVSLAPEAGKDFQAVAAAVQANPMAVLLDSGCYHHRMGTKTVFVDMVPSDDVKHSTKVVALRTIVSETMSTLDRLHARLAHVNVDTIKSSAKHKVATGLDIIPSTGVDPPCVSCVGGKLARHTFPEKGSNAEEALAVVHIDLCGPFRVAAKDGSLFFLLLKDRHTRFVWVMPVAKKSDVLREFQKWLNGMAEREMRTAVESVGTMLLHMDVQHHWWHLALQQAVWVRNCLERSTTPPGTTPYQLLTGKKPDLTLARVWGCMVQFMVPEQQRGLGGARPDRQQGGHVGRGDLPRDLVIGSVEGEVWAGVGADTLTATVPLLAEVDEPADEDVAEVLPPPLDLAPPFPITDRPLSTLVSATDDEGSLEVSHVAPASGIAGSRQGAKLADQDGKSLTTREQ